MISCVVLLVYPTTLSQLHHTRWQQSKGTQDFFTFLRLAGAGWIQGGMVFGVGSWDSRLKVRLWSPLIGIQQSGNQKKLKVHCMLQLENYDHSRIWSLTFVWKGVWGLPSYNGISYVMSPEFLKLQRCRPCDTKDNKDQHFTALQDSKQLVLYYIYWTQRMLKILGIMRIINELSAN